VLRGKLSAPDYFSSPASEKVTHRNFFAFYHCNKLGSNRAGVTDSPSKDHLTCWSWHQVLESIPSFLDINDPWPFQISGLKSYSTFQPPDVARKGMECVTAGNRPATFSLKDRHRPFHVSKNVLAFRYNWTAKQKATSFWLNALRICKH
jgi:hypothetical protein